VGVLVVTMVLLYDDPQFVSLPPLGVGVGVGVGGNGAGAGGEAELPVPTFLPASGGKLFDPGISFFEPGVGPPRLIGPGRPPPQVTPSLGILMGVVVDVT
jgi:hypothetical protein